MEWRPRWGPRERKTDPLFYCELHFSSQDPLQQRTAWAISQLATRRYQASCRQAQAEWPDSGSSCSSTPMCAICLEEFSEGQVRCPSLKMEMVAGARVERVSCDYIWVLHVLCGRGHLEIWSFCWLLRTSRGIVRAQGVVNVLSLVSPMAGVGWELERRLGSYP